MKNQTSISIAIAMILSASTVNAGCCSLKKLTKSIEKRAKKIETSTKKRIKNPITFIAPVTILVPTKKIDRLEKDTKNGVDKLVKELENAGGNIEETVSASGTYIDRQIRASRDLYIETYERIKDGDILEAGWHLTVDPFKNTEENAARATLESSGLRLIGQVAASAYGGPAGAAAFSGWYTYNATGGDFDAALKGGVITGLTSMAFAEINELPPSQFTEKVALTTATGTAATAASGGDSDDILKAAALSGGMVIAQEVYKKTTGHKLDSEAQKASKGDPYCKLSLNQNCSPTNTKGEFTVNVKEMEIRRPHVGIGVDTGARVLIGTGENSYLMQGLSKIPGFNAMAYFHDEWATGMSSFNTKLTILPAIAMTYIGTEAPISMHIQDVDAKNE